MHLLHRATWLLAAAAGAAVPLVSGPSGIVQVDIVSPRPNETYAPTPILPLILGFQNPELTPYLHNAYVQVSIIDPRLGGEAWRRSYRGYTFDLRWANFSRPDRQFEYHALTGFDVEGTWEMRWELRWLTCYQSESGSLHRNVSIAKGPATTFTIKKGAPEQDLLSSINNCAAGSAVAFNVTETLYTPRSDAYYSVHESRCPVPASVPVAPDPCRVHVDAAAASSLAAAVTFQACSWSEHPEGLECPKKERATKNAATGSRAGLAAVLSMLAFVLVI